MAARLGSAFGSASVTLEPDATGFAAKARGLLDKSRLSKDVKIGFDDAKARLGLDNLQARLAVLARRHAELKVDVKDKAAIASLIGLDAKISLLSKLRQL